MAHHDSVFANGSVAQHIDEWQRRLEGEIAVLHERDFRGASDDELYGRAESKHPLGIPTIVENEVGEPEVDVDLQVDVSGYVVKYRAKIDGDISPIHWVPSTQSTSGPPDARCRQGQLFLSYSIPERGRDAEAIAADAKNRFSGDMERIQRYLDWVIEDIMAARPMVRRAVLAKIAARRASIEKAAEVRRRLGL